MAAKEQPVKENHSISQKYQHHTHEEHILNVPDTYIGSVEAVKQEMYVFNEEQEKIVKREIDYIPGLYKIFDEIIVNSLDQYVRCNVMNETEHKVRQLKVSIEPETGIIDVYNDGKGIDIIEHPKYKVYVPHMIFGKLLTSTNYNKKEKKIVGGKNGYGAKLTNIYSSMFEIQTVDVERKLHYKQVFRDNMKTVGKPKIKEYNSKPYTRIRFLPDYARFGVESLTPDMISLFHKRVYDCAGLTGPDLSVFLNKKKLPVKSFRKFVELFTEEDTQIIHERMNEHWEICICKNESFDQISYVNSVNTFKGGKHVDQVLKDLCNEVITFAEKKHKIKLKLHIIRDQLRLFLRCNVMNPSFDSQTKEYLTTPYSRMGTSFDMPKKLVKSVVNLGILEQAMAIAQAKEMKALTKNEGKKKNKIRGIPKLEDATYAGTNKSKQCTLILTEGDSAATTAISGLKVIGKDYFGVFPLKGKLINVREHNPQKVHSNEEIQNIKKIIGLQTGMKYDDISNLRYGSVIILTDQDHDGSHIKGLVMNMFHHEWPELLEKRYVKSMLTPIIKVFKGKQEKSFYTIQDYERWAEQTADASRWRTKYYKGLGTSSPAEARQYFRDMNLLEYLYEANRDNDKVLLAFAKEKIQSRKAWLRAYNKDETIDAKEREIQVDSFIDKELIHFSNADNIRSLPNVIDGLKKSQRKVLFSCFKRNLTKEIRVAQLAGYVSEHAGYHHGEASLNGTIINMAQNFLDSNNINLLRPIGQFGSRLLGGKDSASPRYIHTCLEKITSVIFRALDIPVLDHLDDDGLPVEPTYYAPIIPMILVNGSSGIGTGFSTDIPKYDVREIISNLEKRIRGEELAEMAPSYCGFKGSVEKISNTTYIARGEYKVDLQKNTVEILELPPGTWTRNYKEMLEKLIPDTAGGKNMKKCVKSVEDNYNDIDVYFKITFYPNYLNKLVERKTKLSKGSNYEVMNLEKYLKLYQMINLSNIHGFDSQERLRKFSGWQEIFDEFYTTRLGIYDKRKKEQLRVMDSKIEVLSEKVRFIRSVVNKELNIMNADDDELLERMGQEGMNFKPLDTPKDNDPLAVWNYLLSMHVRTLTKKKMEDLQKDHDALVESRNTLHGTSLEDIWLQELRELKVEYSQFLKHKNEYLENMKVENEVTEGDGIAKRVKRRRRAVAKPKTKK
jgi:DNA topoisomerase-2